MQAEVRGRRIGYDDRGSGPPVVLLHPFPFDRLLWAGTSHALAAHFRVITVDARGFGESPLDEPYAIADLADDLAALLAALQVPQAAVVGMSMGGYTALAFAARHAARLGALVLADTRAAADTPEGRKKRDEGIALCRKAGGAAYLASSLARLVSPGAPPALLAHLRARAEDRLASLVAGLEALRDRRDRTAELPAIACPTLVVGGDAEQVIPTGEMRGMAGAIPNGRFVALPGAGHLAHVEAPGPFEQAVADFLAGVTRAAAP